MTRRRPSAKSAIRIPKSPILPDAAPARPSLQRDAIREVLRVDWADGRNVHCDADAIAYLPHDEAGRYDICLLFCPDSGRAADLWETIHQAEPLDQEATLWLVEHYRGLGSAGGLRMVLQRRRGAEAEMEAL
jgi:hypothetical protein